MRSLPKVPLKCSWPGFFRAIRVNEAVTNDLEFRPRGLESLEFDDAGTLEIEFIATKTGT